MKPLFVILCILAIFCSPGCGQARAAGNADRPFTVVASTFPVYLFTANICANVPNVRVRILIPPSVGCPHDFALRPQDMQKLAGAGAVVINGAGLESFLEKTLAESGLPILDASHGVSLLSSMVEPETEAHQHGDHAHTHNINPHIFASPYNASLMVRNIAAGLAELDPQNSEAYLRNADNYRAILDNLSNKLKEVGLQAKNRGIALEHDALEYLAQNANLDIVAIFENNLSAAGILQMTGLLKKMKPQLLAGDSQYSDRLLTTLARETGIPQAQLNPCASGPEDAAPNYYQTVMEKNLDILNAYYKR